MNNLFYNIKEINLIKQMLDFIIQNEDVFEDWELPTIIGYTRQELIDIRNNMCFSNIKINDFCILVIELINNITGYPHNLKIPFDKILLNNLSNKTKEFINKFDGANDLIMFSHDGLILYGPYTSYSIYIDQDTDTKEYTIYLWKKDIENSGIEFKIKNKEELQKFFEDNDILVEWEENENI